MEKDKLDQPVWFPEWGTVLQHEAFDPEQREHYRQALVRYLRYCKLTGQRATVASARREHPEAAEAAPRAGRVFGVASTSNAGGPLEP
jgi:hypothetical protein